MVHFFEWLLKTGFTVLVYGPQRQKTSLWWFANNTGADQPAHPRSLISAFVIHVFESILSRLDTSEISNFKIAFVAEETDLSLAFKKNEDRFCCDEAYIESYDLSLQVHTEKIQKEAETDLLSLICETYTVSI